jgi:hypothetical protein
MATMKKAQSGKKLLPKAGKQTPADFDPESYDKKYPRTPGGGANYPEPNGKRGAGPFVKKPKMKMGGTVKKAQDGSAFAKLAPPFDKATYADKIEGATRNKAKSGAKMKKAQMGADMMQSPMMKKGGSVKKCKYGCK